ncbi:MAG: hypothetical protein WC971_08155 [Coriobacteriia bacterium]
MDAIERPPSRSSTGRFGFARRDAVYLELRRRLHGTRDGAISYYSTAASHQVDFIVGDPETGQATRLVQVCADLSRADTREREVRALEEAMGETGLRESTIVTMHDAEDLTVADGVIHVVPAWAWALGI